MKSSTEECCWFNGAITKDISKCFMYMLAITGKNGDRKKYFPTAGKCQAPFGNLSAKQKNVSFFRYWFGLRR